jgi:phospholipid/cholesterol/gamma-HCH transport system substrate-binding protein
MKRNFVETLLGAMVIVIAIGFFVFGYSKAEVSTGESYDIVAFFSGVGGLRAGDSVQVSGVKVGSVKKVELDSDTYLARVTLSIQDDVKIPTDTAALISSESLLGGMYLGLEPGGNEEVLPAGGRIEYTQAPQNLEQLLGQFIFNMQDKKEGSAAAASSAPSAP